MTAGPVTQLAGRRILVVDDNATNRRVVRDILHTAGTRIEEAADGAAGLAAIRHARDQDTAYDLAIIDAQMPELSGFDLAAAVRSDPYLTDTPLLMLTSAGEPGDGQRCRELGIRGYLTKPIPRSDLLDAVVAVLGGSAPSAGAEVITRHSIAESRRHLKILLAEDNPVNQEVAASMLRKRGHRVDLVGDGREAVEAVSRNRYDLVLMDVQMPEMDGFEATHAIRATAAGRDLPIIALTAHALDGERERCLSHGMSGYLSKPFKAHELFAAVESPQKAAAGAAPASGDGSAQVASHPVDLAGFRRDMRDAGAEAAVDQILETFLNSVEERIRAITTAVAAGSTSDIARAAHAFKSAAAAIGARGLAHLLQQAEAAGQADDLEGARGLTARIEAEGVVVARYLRLARGAGGAAAAKTDGAA
jgi:CheY-like chemotaxis protein